MQKIISIIALVLLLIACRKIDNQVGQEAIARVNNMYLYKDDIKDLVPKDSSKDDSTNIVNNYINIWATKQLFIDLAKRNLADEALLEFQTLVEDYKNTLYINAYKDAVISKSIDIEITDQDLQNFYEENQRNFILNEELVQFRYLHLPLDYKELIATKQQFDRFKEEDRQELEGKKLEFITYSLNDSLWVSFDRVLKTIPILKNEDKNKLLKRRAYVQLKDSSGIYMVRVNEVLKRKEVAPLDYVKSRIRQIIIEQKKRELIKNLEKDITKDAIKNKQFEIYN